MADYEIVPQPPAPTNPKGRSQVADWDSVAKRAVEISPSWIAVPNAYRPHAQQIRNGEKKAFARYQGRWETMTRKRPGDDHNKATIYIRYLP